MHTVYLALGSNVGDRAEYIEKAVRALSEKVFNMRRAPVYVSRATVVTDQDDFLNTTLYGETELDMDGLLAFVKKTEIDTGRVRRFENGPREIDIDILLYDDTAYSDETLTVPHPKMAERDFVLRPLSDLSPDLVHPVLKRKVSKMLCQIHPSQLSVRGTYEG